jgi:four helix bundle protein
MAESPIRAKSFAFALKIIRLSNELDRQRQYVISNQLVRAGTSIGSNVEEAQAGTKPTGLCFEDGDRLQGSA